jgi:hypothetical protein
MPPQPETPPAAMPQAQYTQQQAAPMQEQPGPLFIGALPQNPAWAPPPPGFPGSPGVRLRPMSIGEIFDESLRIYRRHFTKFTTAFAILIIPRYILLVLLAFYTSREFRTFFDSFYVKSVGQIAKASLFFLTALMLFFLANVSIKITSDARLGLDPGLRDAFRFVARKSGALIWTSVLAAALTCFASLGFLLPGLVVAVMYSLSLQVAILETRGGPSAMKRSAFLTQSFWWRTFLAGLLGFCFIMVAATLPSAIIGLFKVFLGDTASYIISVTLNEATLLLTAPLIPILTTVIYYDLRTRKEGLDIESACDSLWP